VTVYDSLANLTDVGKVYSRHHFHVDLHLVNNRPEGGHLALRGHIGLLENDVSFLLRRRFFCFFMCNFNFVGFTLEFRRPLTLLFGGVLLSRYKRAKRA